MSSFGSFPACAKLMASCSTLENIDSTQVKIFRILTRRWRCQQLNLLCFITSTDNCWIVSSRQSISLIENWLKGAPSLRRNLAIFISRSALNTRVEVNLLFKYLSYWCFKLIHACLIISSSIWFKSSGEALYNSSKALLIIAPSKFLSNFNQPVS